MSPAPPTFSGKAASTVAASTSSNPKNSVTSPSTAYRNCRVCSPRVPRRRAGPEFATIGHSERRRLYAETDAVVVAKLQAAQRNGLTPIVCVGETLAVRLGGNAANVVLAQLDAIDEGAGPSDTSVGSVEIPDPVHLFFHSDFSNEVCCLMRHVRVSMPDEMSDELKHFAEVERITEGQALSRAIALLACSAAAWGRRCFCCS